MTSSAEPWTPARRSALLAEAFALMTQREEWIETGATAHPSLAPTRKRASDRLRELFAEYDAGLPTVALSRSPFTDKTWAIPFDALGINGLWWNQDHPLRQISQLTPSDAVAFQGAVAVNKKALEPAPFLAVPGPEKPFVIKRLLAMPSVVAVVSHVRVGGLDAYPVVYFSREPFEHEKRTNDWGANAYTYVDSKGALREGARFDAEDNFDYQLADWITNDKLRWIAPGDRSMALQRSVNDCPYLSLPGKQAVWRYEEGDLWYGDEVK